MLDRIYTAQLQKTIDALYMENYGDFKDHLSYKSLIWQLLSMMSWNSISAV